MCVSCRDVWNASTAYHESYADVVEIVDVKKDKTEEVGVTDIGTRNIIEPISFT